MVYGKTSYLHPKMEYFIGLVKEEIIAGPEESVKSKTNNYIRVIPGRTKKSALAKKIKSQLKGGHVDDIIRFLPSGGAEVKK